MGQGADRWRRETGNETFPQQAPPSWIPAKQRSSAVARALGGKPHDHGTLALSRLEGQRKKSTSLVLCPVALFVPTPDGALGKFCRAKTQELHQDGLFWHGSVIMGIRKISPFGLLISLSRHDTLHRHRVRNAIDYPILVLLVHVLSHPSSNTYAESDSAFSWRMHKNDEPRGLELAMLAIASGAAVDLARTGLQAVPSTTGLKICCRESTQAFC